ncbi:hypothetical protein MD588_15705 [Photobacterium sp. SDRW27]|uniref:hypothetical protein n=1 Tax=Photobacterium obscurum TaxID=2829490 RepID=UPI00224345AB|nr:hypothetical protein [Photobacterium obscurum]MCW8330256.1 hypothetical protein [Photobacterium obscurum]
MSINKASKIFALMFITGIAITAASLATREKNDEPNIVTCKPTERGLIECGNNTQLSFRALPQNLEPFLSLFCEHHGEQWCDAKDKYSSYDFKVELDKMPAVTAAELQAGNSHSEVNIVICQQTDNGLIHCDDNDDTQYSFLVPPPHVDMVLSAFCQSYGDVWCDAKDKYSSSDFNLDDK